MVQCRNNKCSLRNIRRKEQYKALPVRGGAYRVIVTTFAAATAAGVELKFISGRRAGGRGGRGGLSACVRSFVIDVGLISE